MAIVGDESWRQRYVFPNTVRRAFMFFSDNQSLFLHQVLEAGLVERLRDWKKGIRGTRREQPNNVWGLFGQRKRLQSK